MASDTERGAMICIECGQEITDPDQAVWTTTVETPEMVEQDDGTFKVVRSQPVSVARHTFHDEQGNPVEPPPPPEG